MKYPLTLLTLLALLFSDMAVVVLAGEADATTKPSKPTFTEIVSGAEFSEGAAVRGPRRRDAWRWCSPGMSMPRAVRRFWMRWP